MRLTRTFPQENFSIIPTTNIYLVYVINAYVPTRGRHYHAGSDGIQDTFRVIALIVHEYLDQQVQVPELLRYHGAPISCRPSDWGTSLYLGLDVFTGIRIGELANKFSTLSRFSRLCTWIFAQLHQVYVKWSIQPI